MGDESADGKWEPRTAPSGTELAIEELRKRRGARRQNDAIRLRNFSNWVWGRLSAWMILGLTFALLNRRMATTGPDPLSQGGILAVWAISITLSVGAELILARCYVVVGGAEFAIRNPLRYYRMQLENVGEVERGFWGFQVVKISNRRIRIFGLEESTKMVMDGGGVEVDMLRVLIDRAGGGPGKAKANELIDVRWRVFSGWLLLLLLGWATYFLTFFFLFQ